MSNRLPQLFADSFFPAFAADPFADENFFRTPTVFGRHADRVMKTDIRETDTNYELAIDLPGFKKDEINVEIADGYLTIQASKGLDKDRQELRARHRSAGL